MYIQKNPVYKQFDQLWFYPRNNTFYYDYLTYKNYLIDRIPSYLKLQLYINDT